jgi:hypothetical protein
VLDARLFVGARTKVAITERTVETMSWIMVCSTLLSYAVNSCHRTNSMPSRPYDDAQFFPVVISSRPEIEQAVAYSVDEMHISATTSPLAYAAPVVSRPELSQMVSSHFPAHFFVFA